MMAVAKLAESFGTLPHRKRRSAESLRDFRYRNWRVAGPSDDR